MNVQDTEHSDLLERNSQPEPSILIKGEKCIENQSEAFSAEELEKKTLKERRELLGHTLKEAEEQQQYNPY